MSSLISMTGFARHEHIGKNFDFFIEIKSLNNRFFETSVRIPQVLSSFEFEIKNILKAALLRGRVDFSIKIEKKEGFSELEFSEEVFKEEYALFERAQSLIERTVKLDSGSLLKLIDKARNTATPPEDISLDEVFADVHEGIKNTIDLLIAVRKREGEKLEADITQRLKEIMLCHGRVSERVNSFQKERFELLKKKIGELLAGGTIDETRIIQETAILNERSDVSEELTRISVHLSEFQRIISHEATPGKKLDFLCQELHREWNTVASKSQDSEVTKHSITARSEIEKMREQVQNVV